MNIGVAAHITAVLLGGPRYNPSLSEIERRSATNGIWLCQNCAKLIDNDPARFAEWLLRRWKQVAEQFAEGRIGKPSPFDKRGAPELRVTKEGVYKVTMRPLNDETPNAEFIEQIRGMLPDDLGTPSEVKLLDRGRSAVGQPYAVLGVPKNSGWDWDVIFLSASELGWEVVARISLSGQKGHEPKVIYIPGSPGALGLTHIAGYGTGVFRRSTTWYRITKDEPAPLLSYPVEFYLGGWGMPFDRHLRSELVRKPPRLQSGMVLEIEFMIEYTIAKHLSPDATNLSLFTDTERLALEWNESAGTFVPRTPNDDFARIDEMWNEDTDGFVKRNLKRLEELAVSGNYEQRKFIRENLLSKSPTAGPGTE